MSIICRHLYGFKYSDLILIILLQLCGFRYCKHLEGFRISRGIFIFEFVSWLQVVIIMMHYKYSTTPPQEKDVTQGQFLSGV